MRKLTEAQQEMLRACLETGRAWATAPNSANDHLLREWTAQGWARTVDNPPPGLVAYLFTDAGRIGLSEKDPAQ